MQIFICSVAPPGGKNQKSATIASKNVISRFYCKKNFWISGHHVAVATAAKFECQKIKNALRLRKLRGRDPLFWFLSIIRICSFIWNGRNMFLNNLQISGFISTESQCNWVQKISTLEISKGHLTMTSFTCLWSQKKKFYHYSQTFWFTFKKKIVRNNPSYEFFQKIFFPKSFY